MTTSILSRIWPSKGTQYLWPEQQAGVKPNLGICFSGGGTRALSAAMGQMRALLSLGFLQQADYISSVSGGSWASAAFAYYREGASSDEQFLGPITDPGDITLAGLEQLDPGCLGHTATADLGDVLLKLMEKVPLDLLWETAIGQVFFEPFGLWDASQPLYFSLDAATVQAIQAANPSLESSSFLTVRTPASYRIPYLLVNATLDGPAANAPYDPDPRVMVNYSPLGCGIPYQSTLSYPVEGGRLRRQVLVGGGFIEPFAWGCGTPLAPPVNGMIRVPPPPRPFGLALASGTSSAAFAAAFQQYRVLDGLLPEGDYWPPVVGTGTHPRAERYLFGDGGNLEDLGLIPLLLRGVKKIVVFANSGIPLNVDYDPAHPPTESDLDSDLSTLFGFPTSSVDLRPGTASNLVFPRSDWPALVTQLQTAKRNGLPMVVPMTHCVQHNTWWGLEGGEPVTVLYVYLDRVSSWESHLEWEIQAELALGPVGKFRDFPNYAIIDENLMPPQNLTQLTPSQVNLLADLTCWVVRQSRGAFANLI